MLAGLLRYVPKFLKQNEDSKDPLKIRVSLFFDGTLNNRVNIGEREGNTDIYKENKTIDANSYDNGRTNIAIMEPHIGKKADGYNFFYKAYIAGQGALNFKKDSLVGYAAGGGISGVADRAEEGVKEAVQLISKNIDRSKFYIEKLTIDVFGFSRGAATARYAIHLLLTGDSENYRFPVIQRLRNRGYECSQSVAEVCFAGLYDTVLSYFGSQYFPYTNNVLQQRAVARAEKALHLAAAEEHRRDFPLHNIKSAKSKAGEEYFLPGVHSDVGGSYNMANEKELEKEKDESKKIYMKTTNEGLVIKEGYAITPTMVINEGDPDIIENDRKYLIAQGWYKESQITTTVLAKTRAGAPAKMALTVKRLGIHSAYSNIPLKIMAERARKPDVNIKINTKLEDRANLILSKEHDLLKLEETIKKYVASKKNTKDSKPEDWLDEQFGLNTPELKAIRNKHFHFSASKMKMGYAPRLVVDEKTNLKSKRRRREYNA